MSRFVKAAKIAALVISLAASIIAALGWGLILGENLENKSLGMVITCGAAFALWILAFKRVRVLFQSNWRRIALLFTGQGLYQASSWAFDNPIYMMVVAKLGPGLGGAIMSAAALLICLVTLWVHEAMKKDWVGVTEADILKEKAIRLAKRLSGLKRENIPLAVFFLLVASFWTLACNTVVCIVGAGELLNPASIMAGLVLTILLVVFLSAKLFILFVRLIERGGDTAMFFFLSIVADSFLTVAYLRHGVFNGLRRKDYLLLFASNLVVNIYWTLRTYAVITLARVAGETLFPEIWREALVYLNQAFCLMLGWAFGC